MRAAIWEGPGQMRVGEVPDASCPPDGVLLRVTACGICGTDVRAFFNGDRRISPGWVLGHEISGELIEVGAEAASEIALAGLGPMAAGQQRARVEARLGQAWLEMGDVRTA